MSKEIKIFNNVEVKESNEKDLTVTHFISTERPDRGGDIMRADGMKVNGKPVVLLGHGYTEMGSEPIAKPISLRVGEFNGYKGIIATTQFFPDEVGKRLWEKTTKGFMGNWSIGFIALKKEDINNPNGYGRDIKEWELLEYSLVGVPMNPDAQTLGIDDDKVWVKFAQEGEQLQPEYKSINLAVNEPEPKKEAPADPPAPVKDESQKAVDSALAEKLDALIVLNQKLLDVLSALPKALEKNQQQIVLNPSDTGNLTIVPDEKVQETVVVFAPEPVEQKGKVIVSCSAEELQAKVKEIVTSYLRTEINKLTGKID